MSNILIMRQMLNRLKEDTDPQLEFLKLVFAIQGQGASDANLNLFLEKIQQFPTLYKQHEEAKKAIKKVYRGIPFGDGDDPDHRLQSNAIKKKSQNVLQNQNNIVSTSSDSKVAMRFAFNIGTGFTGDLAHWSDVGTEKIEADYGFVITYTRPSILLVMDVFEPLFIKHQFYYGKVGYDEHEIIINTRNSRATISYYEKDDESYEGDNDDEDYDIALPLKAKFVDDKKIENAQLSAFLSNPPAAIKKFNKTGVTLSPNVRAAIVKRIQQGGLSTDQLQSFLQAIQNGRR